jgi:hypothetical protein
MARLRVGGVVMPVAPQCQAQAVTERRGTLQRRARVRQRVEHRMVSQRIGAAMEAGFRYGHARQESVR